MADEHLLILTEAERRFAQAKIDKLSATGEIKAKKIFGLDWPSDSAQGFGERFKASVNAGHLTRIRFVRTGTDNHARYEIG